MNRYETWSKDDSFDLLEKTLYALLKNRVNRLEIEKNDQLYLEEMLGAISINGSIPEWAVEGPSETENDDYEVLVEGRAIHPITEEYEPVYVQWANKNCVRCIYIGIIDKNMSVFSKSKTVFYHNEARNLDPEEIDFLVLQLKHSKWAPVTIQSSRKILDNETT